MFCVVICEEKQVFCGDDALHVIQVSVKRKERIVFWWNGGAFDAPLAPLFFVLLLESFFVPVPVLFLGL